MTWAPTIQPNRGKGPRTKKARRTASMRCPECGSGNYVVKARRRICTDCKHVGPPSVGRLVVRDDK